MFMFKFSSVFSANASLYPESHVNDPTCNLLCTSNAKGGAKRQRLKSNSESRMRSKSQGKPAERRVGGGGSI
jgi:hypothetical protein